MPMLSRFARKLHSPRSILKGFLAKGFLTAVASLNDGLVSATLEVYGKVEREMLPTPSRPHYTFNLRDISKVVQVSSSRFFIAMEGGFETEVGSTAQKCLPRKHGKITFDLHERA